MLAGGEGGPEGIRRVPGGCGVTTIDPDAPSFPVVPGYEVGAVLGIGGFAVVYRARQVSMHRDVALKVLEERPTDAAAMSVFERECRAAGSLSWHPHVVPVHDAGRTDAGKPYLAMELVPGGSLADTVRRRGPVPTSAAARYSADIASALGAAHDFGLLHRDVKPANVLVDRLGRARLADFGIARFAGTGTSTTGSWMGTVAYMAPELLKGEKASTASDVFALGVTLATLALGRHPYRPPGDDNPLVVIGRVLADDRGLLPDDVPDELRAVLAACLDLEADRRPDTGTLARVLGDLAEARPPRRAPVAPTILDEASTGSTAPSVADAPPAPTAVTAVEPSTPEPEPSPDPAEDGALPRLTSEYFERVLGVPLPPLDIDAVEDAVGSAFPEVDEPAPAREEIAPRTAPPEEPDARSWVPTVALSVDRWPLGSEAELLRLLAERGIDAAALGDDVVVSEVVADAARDLHASVAATIPARWDAPDGMSFLSTAENAGRSLSDSPRSRAGRKALGALGKDADMVGQKLSVSRQSLKEVVAAVRVLEAAVGAEPHSDGRTRAAAADLEDVARRISGKGPRKRR